MSYNPNFYNYFPGDRSTFQNSNGLAPNGRPPPPQPPFFRPPPPRESPNISDQDFLRRFEKLDPGTNRHRPVKAISISEAKELLRNTVCSLKSLIDEKKTLQQNASLLPENQWMLAMEEISKQMARIAELESKMSDAHSDLTKLLAKRAAKRLRMKKVRLERQKAKARRFDDLKETSRKIDENLQKMKDELFKAKEEEELKLQANIVLKETLRKRSDAKKWVAKLDALLKLRKARQNTAKGRGETVSESDANSFQRNIELLKSMWAQKLELYAKQEAEVRATLAQEGGAAVAARAEEEEITRNLVKWREFLFGGDVTPHVDFRGDVGAFVNVRSQWDEYIAANAEGSPLPAGWVMPQL